MAPVDSLLFEAAEKAFRHSIIETIASAAHTTHKAVYFQKLPVLPAGILGSTIRMYYQSCLRLTLPDSHS